MDNMAHVYHFVKLEDWENACQAGHYAPPSINEVGFIHLCRQEQIEFVRGKYFAGQTGLRLLEIDPVLVQAEIRYEKSEPDQDTFPHLYGPLNLDAVIGLTPLA